MPTCAACPKPLGTVAQKLGHRFCSLRCFDLARKAKPAPPAAANGHNVNHPVVKCAWCFQPIGADHVQLGDVALHPACRGAWLKLNPPPPVPAPPRRSVRISSGANQQLDRRVQREPLADDRTSTDRRDRDLAGDARFVIAGLARLDAAARARAMRVRVRAGDPLLAILSSVR